MQAGRARAARVRARRMRHPFGIWVIVSAIACTPVGLWLYSTPSITVSRVRLDAESKGRLPVVVALDVLNPNDYAISTTRVELRLSLDDLPIGGLDRDSSVPSATPRHGDGVAAARGRSRHAAGSPAGVPFGHAPVPCPRARHRRYAFREAEDPVRPGRRPGLRLDSFASIRSSRSSCVTVTVMAPNSSSTFPRKMKGPWSNST